MSFLLLISIIATSCSSPEKATIVSQESLAVTSVATPTTLATQTTVSSTIASTEQSVSTNAAASSVDTAPSTTSSSLFPTTTTAKNLTTRKVSESSTQTPKPITSRKALLTWYTSYPDPGSDECINYNGCKWAGYFAALPDKQPLSWVQSNNIAAVHEKYFDEYKLKTLRLQQGEREIDVIVYDKCADSDCNGCCTANLQQNGFLIDIETHTKDRFGVASGEIDWRCLDC